MQPTTPTLTFHRYPAHVEQFADPSGDFATFDAITARGDTLYLNDVRYATLRGDNLDTPFGRSTVAPNTTLRDALLENAEKGRLRLRNVDHALHFGGSVLRALRAYRMRAEYQEYILSKGHDAVLKRLHHYADILLEQFSLKDTSRRWHLFRIHNVPVGHLSTSGLHTFLGDTPCLPDEDDLLHAWRDQLRAVKHKADEWLERNPNASNVSRSDMHDFIRFEYVAEHLDALVFDTQRARQVEQEYASHATPYQLYRSTLDAAKAALRAAQRSDADTIAGVRIDQGPAVSLTPANRERIERLRAFLDAESASFNRFDGIVRLTREGRIQIHTNKTYDYGRLYVLRDDYHQLDLPSGLLDWFVPRAFEVGTSEFMGFLESMLDEQHREWSKHARYVLSVWDRDSYDWYNEGQLLDILDAFTVWDRMR